MNTRTQICCLGCLWKKRISQPVKSQSSASPVLTACQLRHDRLQKQPEKILSRRRSCLIHYMDGLPKTVIETCSPASTDALSWALKEESYSGVYASWYLPLSATGCLRSYTNSIQASTEWKPLLAAMSGGQTSTQTLKGRWRLATTVQECATLRRRHHFSHGHGVHDLGRECISTMPSIKGNISSWPSTPTPSSRRSSPQQRRQQRRPSAICVTFSLPMAFQKK